MQLFSLVKFSSLSSNFVNKITYRSANINSGVRGEGRSSSNKWKPVHLRLSQQRSLQGRPVVLAAISTTLSTTRQLPVLLLRSAAREGQGHVRQHRSGNHLGQVSGERYSLRLYWRTPQWSVAVLNDLMAVDAERPYLLPSSKPCGPQSSTTEDHHHYLASAMYSSRATNWNCPPPIGLGCLSAAAIYDTVMIFLGSCRSKVSKEQKGIR